MVILQAFASSSMRCSTVLQALRKYSPGIDLGYSVTDLHYFLNKEKKSILLQQDGKKETWKLR